MDRMFAGFGPSMFPSFPSLLEDYDREFDFPRLTMAVPLVSSSLGLNQPQQCAPTAAVAAAKPLEQQQQQQAQTQAQAPSQQKEQQRQPLGSSVMCSSEQYYNSLNPKKNYSRHTTTQAGPSGVLESRTAVRDNAEGVERVEVRRQLGDRFTHMGRKRRLDTGEETVEKRGHNVSNEEMEQFEQEWLKVAKENLPLYVHRVMAGLPGEQEGQEQPLLEVKKDQQQQQQQQGSKGAEGGNISIGKFQVQAQPTTMQPEQ